MFNQFLMFFSTQFMSPCLMWVCVTVHHHFVYVLRCLMPVSIMLDLYYLSTVDVFITVKYALPSCLPIVYELFLCVTCLICVWSILYFGHNTMMSLWLLVWPFAIPANLHTVDYQVCTILKTYTLWTTKCAPFCQVCNQAQDHKLSHHTESDL